MSAQLLHFPSLVNVAVIVPNNMKVLPSIIRKVPAAGQPNGLAQMLVKLDTPTNPPRPFVDVLREITDGVMQGKFVVPPIGHDLAGLCIFGRKILAISGHMIAEFDQVRGYWRLRAIQGFPRFEGFFLAGSPDWDIQLDFKIAPNGLYGTVTDILRKSGPMARPNVPDGVQLVVARKEYDSVPLQDDQLWQLSLFGGCEGWIVGHTRAGIFLFDAGTGTFRQHRSNLRPNGLLTAAEKKKRYRCTAPLQFLREIQVKPTVVNTSAPSDVSSTILSST